MSFMDPGTGAPIPGEGNKQAKILIVNESPGKHGFKSRKPVDGPDASVLEQCLHQANLTRHDVYITTLFHDVFERKKLTKGKGKYTKLTYNPEPYVAELRKLVDEMNPNVIVTLGPAACIALTGKNKLQEVRGYVFTCEALNDVKVIPTNNPADMIWSNYIWRYYTGHDFLKARKESHSPDTNYPKLKVLIPKTLAEATQVFRTLKNSEVVCFDIEVVNYTVSMIGFQCNRSDTIFVVHYADKQWSAEEETQLWRLTASVLENPKSTKILQNGIFDVHFLLQELGIFTLGPIDDTMIMHSLMYPDFLKGLGFLASIYTDLPYWKGMVDHKSIKEED